VTEAALVDNDVVLKLCCYGLHASLPDALTGLRPAILGVTRFVLRDRISRSTNIRDRDRAARALEEIVAATDPVEPTDEEAALAAEMEEAATKRQLEFDTGESQLLAMLIVRGGSLLLTGDKRAVVAMHRLGVDVANGRIACLEQLFGTLLDLVDPRRVRAEVCAEPQVDRALVACFACAADAPTREDFAAGLRSYVGHLRRASGETLIPGDLLDVVASTEPGGSSADQR
jgi:hypothetical protein